MITHQDKLSKYIDVTIEGMLLSKLINLYDIIQIIERKIEFLKTNNKIEYKKKITKSEETFILCLNTIIDGNILAKQLSSKEIIDILVNKVNDLKDKSVNIGNKDEN